MSSVLRDIQQEYEARAQAALATPASEAPAMPRKKATRTYTGAALERRRAWGSFWGSILKAHAHELRNEANASE